MKNLYAVAVLYLLIYALPGHAAVEPDILQLSTSSCAASAPRPVRISNPQDVNVSPYNPTNKPLDIALTGEDAESFKINFSTCGSMLPPNGTCQVYISLLPDVEGQRNAILQVNAGEQVILTGTVNPALHVSATPAELIFEESGIQTFTLSNATDEALSVASVSLDGAPEYRIVANNCLDANLDLSDCQVQIGYTKPEDTQARYATVNIVSGPTNSPGCHTLPYPLSGNLHGKPVLTTPSTVNLTVNRLCSAPRTETVTIDNTGTGPLEFIALTLGGEHAADFVLTDPCTGTRIAPGEACSATVDFKVPDDGTLRSGVLGIRTNEGNLAVSLIGMGTAPQLYLAPDRLDFVYNTPTQSMMVCNSGTAAVGITDVRLMGTNVDAFTLANNTCTGIQLEADSCNGGARCGMEVAFNTPASPLPRDARVEIIPDCGETVLIPVNGTGALCAVSTDVPTLNFENGVTDQTVTLRNDGTRPIVLTPALSNNADFTLTGDRCATTLLEPGYSCDVDVHFNLPDNEIPRSGVLNVSADCGTSTAVDLAAVAPPEPQRCLLMTVPETLSFDNSQTQQTVTVTNGGNTPLNLTPALNNTTDFTVISDNCASAPLQAGFSCDMTLDFTLPEDDIARNGLLTITPDCGDSALVSLSGVAVPQQCLLTTNPESLRFDADTGEQTVTVGNAGNVAFSLSSVLSNRDDFIVDTQACGNNILQPGTNCNLSVRFNLPQDENVRSGVLNLNTDCGSNADIELTGGVQLDCLLTATPQNVSFNPNAPVQPVTLINEGTMPVTPNPTLTNPGDFSVLSNTCTAALAPGTGCQVVIRFNRLDDSTPRNGVLNINSNCGTVPVNLAGAGITPPPPAEEIPTLSEWAVILLSVAVLLSGLVSVRRMG